MSQNTQWYWKKEGKVKGPFAAGLIQKYIILGRVHPNDLLSQDKQLWSKASSIVALIPEVLKHKNDENYPERLKAAKRWAEDRKDRRNSLLDDEFELRTQGTQLPIKVLGWKVFTLWLLLVIFIIGAFFYFTPTKLDYSVDCNKNVVSGGTYDECIFRGKNFSEKNLSHSSFINVILSESNLASTDLSYSKLQYSQFKDANLSQSKLNHANLTGANFSQATLAETDFSHADLSYADFRNANVKNIKLNNAKLSKAIWFNGQTCAQGSIGRCLVKSK